MTFFSSIGTNILSSIIYDIGKGFITNRQKPMTEKQILEIIDNYHGEIECIFDRLNRIENSCINASKQNEAIFKLLLMVFDNRSNVTLSCSENGYVLDGNYTLNNLNSIAQKCLQRYTLSLPSVIPKSLSEAVWPIPNNLKGALLDELESNLYNDDY